ncbi:MAG: nucleoside:proton symporter, partial [Acetobacteraceae bacterium]|nr:nucleoside:proton symporter [Acetobacteraceae bacterium]
MTALQAQSGFGLIALCVLAWALGGFRRGISARVLVMGLALQIALGAALLHIAPLRAGFGYLGDAVNALAVATQAGTSLVFGYLGGGALPFQELRPGASFILFFQALPLVLVVGALSALFYHWGILPAIVRVMAGILQRLFGIGGAAGFGVAANVFVGMVEAPLMIRAWLARMTRAELFVVMTAGLATISGNTLVVYALMIAPVVPDAAGQLLTASLISAPAAILAALLMLPAESVGGMADHDTGAPVKLYDSSMDALVRGTQDGLSLLLGIMASLIVFVALVALVNMALQPLTGFTLQGLLGVLLWPVAWAMGVPAHEAATVASSLGVKI